MSKKFKIKIKYCVKPQTVLTVQKENAFFAASISTSVTILHLWIVHNSQSSAFPKTKQFSRWTDQWDSPMATSATEGPAGAGSTVALPREVMCWQGPLQLPPIAFWRAPARAGAQCPSWASSKSNPVGAAKMGNERHFGTLVYPWQPGDISTTKPVASAQQGVPDPHSVCELQPGQMHSTLKIDSCFQDCPELFEASLSPEDTMLDTTESTNKLHGWLVLTQNDTSERPWHGSFAHVKNMWYHRLCYISKLYSGSLCFSFSEDKKQLTEFPDIHHILAEGNASDFVVIWVSQCQSLFLFLYI